MEFKEWINENASRTGAKLGLVPPLSDAIGQHPPLYAAPKSADFVTYFYIQHPNGLPTNNGIVDMSGRHQDKLKINKFTWSNFRFVK
jgi:hypothetical protein